MKNVYFYRNYAGLTGGHLKVHHYFKHTSEAQGYTPWIYFTNGSLMDSENPWYPDQDHRLQEWQPMDADLLFIGGMDWLSLPEKVRGNYPVPIINLIQGKRHANTDIALFTFLTHRAVRICVSKEVQLAIESTGMVNGPVFTIENGLDINEIELVAMPAAGRKYDICIAGLKNPSIARALENYFSNKNVNIICLVKAIPRQQFLEILGQSRIAVVLPLQQEGCFLPFWEAAAAGCIPICPIHDGATADFQHGVNGFFPNYSLEGISQAVQHCQQLDETLSHQISYEAKALTLNRSLDAERKQFYAILNDVNQLYGLYNT